MQQSWTQVLIRAHVDGPALANSTTATSLLPPAAKKTLAANFVEVNDGLMVDAHGRISNIVTTPGTLTLDLKLGSVVVATSGAMALNVVAKTNVPWVLRWQLTCRAIGTSANFMHQGTWTSEAVIGSPLPSAGGAGTLLLPSSAPAVGSTFDSTAAQVVDLVATWSVANAGNSITLHGFELVSR